MLYIVLSISNIVCFIIGAVVGQKVVKGEKVITTPKEAIKKAKFDKKREMNDNYYDTILRNIDNYNPNGTGQEELPQRS